MYRIQLLFTFLLLSQFGITQNTNIPKSRAINGYYYKNILPFSPLKVGFGVTVPTFINSDTLIDFYTAKIKYPQNNGNPDSYGNEVSTLEAYINDGNYNFKNQTYDCKSSA